ncbi:MAG: hypothetical protein AAGN82_26665 [Myxococcota bacterium]
MSLDDTTEVRPGRLRRPPLVSHAVALAVTSLLAGACRADPKDAAARADAGSTGTVSSRTSPSSPTVDRPRPAAVGRRDAPLSLPEVVGAISPAEAARRLPSHESAAVYLIDRGVAPRVPLRYSVPAGNTPQRLTVEVQTAMSVRDGDATEEVPVPAIAVAVDVVMTPAVHGGARIDATVASVAMSRRQPGDAAPGQDPPAARIAATLKGATATMGLSPRGVFTPPPPDPSPAARAQRQLLASVWAALADGFVIAPGASIGDGAQWESLSRRRRAGAMLLRLERVRWQRDKGREGGQARVEVREVAISGPARDVDGKVVTHRTQSGIALGKRLVTQELGFFWPVASTGELATDLVFDLTAPGAPTSARRTAIQLTEVVRLGRGGLDAAGVEGQSPRHGR